MSGGFPDGPTTEAGARALERRQRIAEAQKRAAEAWAAQYKPAPDPTAVTREALDQARVTILASNPTISTEDLEAGARRITSVATQAHIDATLAKHAADLAEEEPLDDQRQEEWRRRWAAVDLPWSPEAREAAQAKEHEANEARIRAVLGRDE